MKSLILLGLLTMVACSEITPPAAQNDGNTDYIYKPQLMKGSATLDTSFNRLQQVCQALEYKDTILPEQARTYTRHILDLNVNPCIGMARNEQGRAVVIERLENGYYFAFEGDSGNFAPISSVESRYTGEMAIICNMRSNLTDQIELASNNALSLSVIENAPNCLTDVNHVCVHIAKGPLNAEKSSIIANEKHWIRFRTTGEVRGFYAIRRKLTACSAGGFEEKIQTFR